MMREVPKFALSALILALASTVDAAVKKPTSTSTLSTSKATTISASFVPASSSSAIRTITTSAPMISSTAPVSSGSSSTVRPASTSPVVSSSHTSVVSNPSSTPALVVPNPLSSISIHISLNAPAISGTGNAILPSVAPLSSSVASTSGAQAASTSAAHVVSSPVSSLRTTSLTSTSTLPVASPSKTSVPAGYLRGANAGGWLILETWMNQALLNDTGAPDQLTFDALPQAAVALGTHWATYFTEADVAALASFGMNALRIPIGFWAFDNSGTNYLSGAEYWLDQAILWARLHGMKVLVDIHGSQGSQNGFEHSGSVGNVGWQVGSNTSYLGANMDKSLKTLDYVATKYGSALYQDVVFGIEIVNEPLSWGANNFTVTKNWAATAYNIIMEAASNPNLQVITHDGFMGPQNWWDLASAINGNLAPGPPQFALDLHLYQNMQASDDTLDVPGHIQAACDWGNSAKNSMLPIYVGEFSAAINVCVNPDGSSFGDDGTVECTVTGCQCTRDLPISEWGPALKQATRMYVEAQLQTFEEDAVGYFIWSMHAFGAWSLVELVHFGIIGPTIDDRMYGKQCTYLE